MSRSQCALPNFFTDPSVLACSIMARSMFLHLRRILDAPDVYCREHVNEFAEALSARFGHTTPEMVRGWIDELIANGLVIEYEAIDDVPGTDTTGTRGSFWVLTPRAERLQLDPPRELQWPPISPLNAPRSPH